MKEITLEKLNSSSFESIAKALAMEKFGSAGQVFPQGPDGGRDFSFEGKIKTYESQNWDGYLVLQAKFKSNIRGTDDVKWLIEQLKIELRKFLRPDSAYKKPEYYIIATNINLSGADSKTKTTIRKSGLTKVAEHMNEWSASIGLKGFDIWPADKIETFLAASSSIRTTYLASILPGDILRKISDSLSQKEKSLEYALKLSLIHLLKRDRNVRLKDAGSLSDDDIRTSQVFVDLPTRDHGGRTIQKFVRRTIEQAKGIYGGHSQTTDTLLHKQDRNNKIVLLGGPGQGKSTASLFLTQLFRASLIKESTTTALDEQTKFLVSEIFERAECESIGHGIPSRYPAWISLPQFADKISYAKTSKTKKPSLLSFVADEISETSQSDVTVDDLRGWLKSFPWFFTFDGLDEVPPSGERDSVITAIQELITEVELLGGDALFVVTSRPQGYNSDLESDAWTHKVLIDLPIEAALSYAKLLAKSYYKDDPYRQNKIVSQLERSADRPTTQRLMKSPLQVTILHMIVDTGGGVPNSRWSLFHEYFEILKKREKSKGGEVQKILDKNITQIGPIHQRAGLVLHVDAEIAGSATASLSMEKLSKLIENFLINEGFDNLEVGERLSELTELALNRLVLLSSREESKISFDVRSLQEFMAASALTANSPQIIEERLLLLAGKSHWQHVFIIAASRCFSEDNLHYLRSAITQIPKRLEDNHAHRVVGGGALLSFALFSDDIAADHPTYRRLLALHALELLFHGFDHSADLSILVEPHTEKVIYQDLKDRYLSNQNSEVRAAAWGLIISEAEKGHESALRWMRELWPRGDEDVFEIVKHGVLPLFDIRFQHSMMRALLTTPYTKIVSEGSRLLTVLSVRFDGINFETDEKPPETTALDILKVLTAELCEAPTLGAPDQPRTIDAKFLRIDAFSGLELPPRDFDINPEWELIFSAIEFSNDPTLHTLHLCLKKFLLLDLTDENKKLLMDKLPWVISTSILSLDDSLHDLGYPLSADYFGDSDSWREAESRVTNTGLNLADYIHSRTAKSCGMSISQVGIIHFSTYSLSSSTGDPEKTITNYIDQYHLSKDDDTKVLLSRFIQFEGIGLSKKLELPKETISRLLEVLDEALKLSSNDEVYVYHEILTSINDFCLPERSIQLLSSVGLATKIIFSNSQLPELKDEPNIHLLCSHLDIDYEKKGLVNLICIFRLLCRNSTTTLAPALLTKLSKDIDASVRFSALTILFLDGKISAHDYALTAYSPTSACSSHEMNVSLHLLENQNLDIDKKIELSSTLVEVYQTSNRRHSSKIKHRLKGLLDSKLSGLSDRAAWVNMSLPADAFFQ